MPYNVRVMRDPRDSGKDYLLPRDCAESAVADGRIVRFRGRNGAKCYYDPNGLLVGQAVYLFGSDGSAPPEQAPTRRAPAMFTPSQRQWLEAQAEARSMTVYDVLRRLVRDAMRARPEHKQRAPRRTFTDDDLDQIMFDSVLL